MKINASALLSVAVLAGGAAIVYMTLKPAAASSGGSGGPSGAPLPPGVNNSLNMIALANAIGLKGGPAGSAAYNAEITLAENTASAAGAPGSDAYNNALVTFAQSIGAI